MVAKIDEVNKLINDLNGKNGVEKGFRMHMFGMRPTKKGKREHKWSEWFEEEDERKLHLKHYKRAEVIKRVQKYFIQNTDW